MATPKSFGVAGGNGHTSTEGMPRMELQDELRAITGESTMASPAPLVARPSPMQDQTDPRAQPQAKPAPSAAEQPEVRRPGPQRRIIKMPPSTTPKPAPTAVPETTSRTPESAERSENAVEVLIQISREEVSADLERALTYLEDRPLAEIVESLVKAYFQDRANDKQVQAAVLAFEEYGPIET